jgi:Cu2+-containing amine oxidase
MPVDTATKNPKNIDPVSRQITAPITEARAIVDPTDKSIPAIRNTTVVPIAATANTDIDTSKFSTLVGERKPGVVRASSR